MKYNLYIPSTFIALWMSDEYYFISNSKVVVIYFWSKYRNLKKDFFKLFGGLNKNLERGAQA